MVIPPPFDLRTLLSSGRVQATMAILQQPEVVAPDFAEQVGDILALLAGTYRAEGFDVHAVPGENAALTPWIFGSSKGRSAQVAGALGLPFVASYHLTPATALEAIETYRDAFVPSAALQRPYVVVSAETSLLPKTPRPRGGWHPATATGCIRFGLVAAQPPTRIPTIAPR